MPYNNLKQLTGHGFIVTKVSKKDLPLIFVDFKAKQVNPITTLYNDAKQLIETQF